MFADHLREMQG